MTDQAWRAALWSTHAVLNRGTAAFGVWLLSLRGGIEGNTDDWASRTTGAPGSCRRCSKSVSIMPWRDDAYVVFRVLDSQGGYLAVL